jgi:TQXA domain-containing protein/LPXTG-motif cell wall-anchored protein
MTSVRRRGLTRLAAGVLAPGLVAAGIMAGAGTASADGNTPQAAPGGATATLTGLIKGEYGTAVLNGREISAGLFGMTVDGGGTLQSYCIDFKHHTQPHAQYKEVGWDQSTLYGNKDAGKIRWILQHSYPQINDFTKLTEEAGAQHTLTKRTAAAGTQVAIWRLSDKVDVHAKNGAAEKLANYLVKAATDTEEPAASLKLDSPAVSGKAGHRLGPITVHTNASSVTVAPDAAAEAAGVKVVGADGAPVTAAHDGSRLYFDVPKGTEPGTASLTVSATTEVPIGRAFAGIGENKGSQTQILAGSSSSTVTAKATATWANEGPIPAVTAQKDCAEGGVDLNVSNQGDETFAYTVNGEKHELAAGKTETVTVPVKEDASYSITVKGEKGFEQTFTGVLDCKTTTTTGDQGGQGTTPQGGEKPADHGKDLAETGSSGNTTMIAGIAIALVVVGGGAMLIVRKRKPASAGSSAGDSKE